MEESKNTWVFDSGFTNDVCVSLRGLNENEKSTRYELHVMGGHGILVLTKVVGEVHFNL